MRSELGRIWPPPPLAGRGPPSRVRRRPSRVGAPHGANYDAYANSDSPSEPSLANSEAINSDVRKNPSVGFL